MYNDLKKKEISHFQKKTKNQLIYLEKKSSIYLAIPMWTQILYNEESVC